MFAYFHVQVPARQFIGVSCNQQILLSRSDGLFCFYKHYSTRLNSIIRLSSPLSASVCIFSTKSPRSDRPRRIYRADLGSRETLGLQACLEWRLLSLLLPLQLKAAACQTFAGNIPGKPWRPIARTSFPLPSVFKTV